jgi:hypothetical protein
MGGYYYTEFYTNRVGVCGVGYGPRVRTSSRLIMKAVIDFQVPWNVTDFVTSRGTISPSS